jgi:Zn-dependent protease with chaperone function
MERNFILVRWSLLLSISIFLLSLPIMTIFLPHMSLFHGSIMLLVSGLVPATILAFMCIGIDTDEYPDTELLDDAFYDRILQEAEKNPVKYKARLRRHLMMGRLYLVVLVVSLIEGCIGVILLGQTLFIPTIILFSGVVGTGLIIYLIFRSLFYRPEFPESPEVLIATPETFPKLIELATATQKKVDAPRIHLIYIVPGDNCAVQLHSDFFGIRKKNIMEIGLDLLMFMDDEELTALFAHELSHIRKKDTLLGYQVTISLIRWVIVGANAENRHYTVRYFLGKFAGYQAASLDFLMKAVRKPQEVEADKLAAEVAGEETAVRFLLKSIALRQVPATPIDFFNITEPDQLPSKPYTQSLSNTRQFSQGNGSDDGLIHLDISGYPSGYPRGIFRTQG